VPQSSPSRSPPWHAVPGSAPSIAAASSARPPNARPSPPGSPDAPPPSVPAHPLAHPSEQLLLQRLGTTAEQVSAQLVPPVEPVPPSASTPRPPKHTVPTTS
jgi:hypothetical protein